MKRFSITEARKNLDELIDLVAHDQPPIMITGNRSNAVLVSEQDWRSIQETLYLIFIPGMRESIVEGLATPLSETSERLDW